MEKKLEQEVVRIQQEYPDALVEIWCEDEHRIGLQPVTRRVWVEEGEQPIATVNWKREWLWVYAFVQPQTGETYWWLLPYVNTAFETSAEVEELLYQRCQRLLKQPLLIRGLTNYHWLPQINAVA